MVGKRMVLPTHCDVWALGRLVFGDLEGADELNSGARWGAGRVIIGWVCGEYGVFSSVFCLTDIEGGGRLEGAYRRRLGRISSPH